MGSPVISSNATSPDPGLPLVRPSSKSAILTYSALTVYGLVVAAAIWHHEPWADEAHAWLLARDSDLTGLWTRLMHYEGSPGLWQTLLYFLIRLGMPYRGEDITSGLLGCAAAYLVMRRSSFPLAIRLLLPFTYFLCYQYVVVARSYSLLPILLFTAALLYRGAEQRIYLFALVLSLLAAVSAHGFLLSGCLGGVSGLRFIRKWKQLEPLTKRSILIAGSAYSVVVLLVILSSWPAKDVTFPAHGTLDAAKMSHFASLLLREGFGGNLFVSLVIIGLSIPLLYAGDGLLLFVLSLAALIGFGGIVYSQVWHSGTLFLAWVMAMWISAANVKMPRTALAAFAIVITIQCYWTAATVSYDWNQPYSGSKEAAAYIQRAGIAQHSIYAIGYSCSAIQPYFPHSIFANYPPGRGYWDWSTRNRANDPAALFAPNAPDYVILGYKARSDMDWLNEYLQRGGYQQVKHFGGHIFWRTYEFEHEDFDLYQRTSGQAVPELSYLEMPDTQASKQLLTGFYNLEDHAWRWTARSFSAVLKTPSKPGVRGARLEVHLYLSPDEIGQLGRITLTADLNGYRLEPQTFSAAGTYTYERDVPASALTPESVIASFAFDKSFNPVVSDGRELGAVITSLGLKPRP